MRVLIGIATHEYQQVRAIRSCYTMRTESQDQITNQKGFYRGDIAREQFVDTILANDDYGPEDALLLLDGDQVHPDNLLDILRKDMEAHNLDMVCAHYYRRSTNPVQSLCYEIGDGRWPYLPYLHPPTEGLHEIAVTGFGCVLIKKKVFQAIKDTLPYGASPVAIGPLPEVTKDHDNFGADFRFFHIARKLGFKLWLDASIESLHAITMLLGRKSAEKLVDYNKWADSAHDLLQSRLEMYGVDLEAFKQRKKILEARLEGFQEKALEAKKRKEEAETEEESDKYLEEHTRFSLSVYEMIGRVKEMVAWIEWAEKYPKIERPDQLPTTENTPKQESVQSLVPDEAAAKRERQETYRDQAIELAQMLPDSGARKFYRGDGTE